MREAIVERQSLPVLAMSRAEQLDHIWSTTASGFRGYGDHRFVPGFAGERVILVFSAAHAKLWKRLDDLDDNEIAAKLPVRFRLLSETIAA
jgi:hypothetical protein